MTRPMVGIVGGLGPWAHIDLEQKILRAFQRRSAGRILKDQDYPSWIVVSLPWTPDRTDALLGRAPSPVPDIVNAIGRLELAGATYVVIACNTAHAFLPAIRSALNQGRADVPVGIELLSIVDLCAEYVRGHVASGAIGVLATTGTLRAGLYQRSLEAQGLKCYSPLDLDDNDDTQDNCVWEGIYGPKGIKALGNSDHALPLFETATQRLLTRFGIQALIAGCTEIPIALAPALDRSGRWRALGDLLVVDPATVIAQEISARWEHGVGFRDEGVQP